MKAIPSDSRFNSGTALINICSLYLTALPRVTAANGLYFLPIDVCFYRDSSNPSKIASTYTEMANQINQNSC
jgi:hypothetical protein